VDRFEDIASTLKSNAGMDGILVNLQLVPDAVVCLLYPLNNTEDFPPGVFMDNSGALGHDLLSDPERSVIAETTLASNEIVIAGPLTLRQCQECDPTVEKAFIARLPIPSMIANDNITLDEITTGRRYGKWGFAVALINWNRLVEQSGIYENFAKSNLEFQLTRTDRIVNATNGSYTDEVSEEKPL
jgi:sensor domain CHASE-containing protein